MNHVSVMNVIIVRPQQHHYQLQYRPFQQAWNQDLKSHHYINHSLLLLLKNRII